MYSLGMIYRDISAQVQGMYNVRIFPFVLSEITGRIIPKIKAWLFRSLWMPCMTCKDHSDMQHRAVYNMTGVEIDDYKMC